MQRKNSGGGEGGGDSWLSTYADMVTLLLTFFAVLLSMSSVNQEKYNAFIRSFSNLPPEVIEEITNPAVNEADTPDTTTAAEQKAIEAMNELYEKLSDYIEKNGMSDTVSIDKINQVIFVKFDSSVFFEPDKYLMRTDGKDTLSFIGDGIKEYESMINLVAVCGHTATVPDNDNSNVSDWMLSGERAAVVAMFFEDEKKIEPKKLLLLGYGKNMPIASNDTEDGRKQNRRVEIIIVGNESDISFDPHNDLKEIYKMMGSENAGTSTSEVATAVPSQSPQATSEKVTASPPIQNDVSPYN